MPLSTSVYGTVTLVSTPEVPGDYPRPRGFLDSSGFAVADKQGLIRGDYDATDGTVPEDVAKAVEQLLDK